MAVLSAIKHNPEIQHFYQRLVDHRKHKKVILIACIQKMITILNAMIRERIGWNNKQHLPLPT